MSQPKTRIFLSLAAALVLLVAAAPASAQTAHSVSVVDSRFVPAELTIQAGDSVTWSNSGQLNHNVHAEDDSFRCANGCDRTGGNGNPSAANWSFTLTFDDPGDVPYVCDVHEFVGMVGVIHVEGQSMANPGDLTLASSNFPVGEGAGSVTVRVNRVNGSDGAVSVDYATGNGTATAPPDYQSASGTLNWGDGDVSSKSFQVSILDDDEDEPQERFNVRLTNPTGGAALGRDRATVTINDNDDAPDDGGDDGDDGDDGGDDGGTGGPGQLRFRQDSYEVDEADGAAMVHVERTGGTSGTVSAQVTATGGTATEDADFMPVTETVTFGGGDMAAKTVMIPILQDEEDEGVETIHVDLSGATGGAEIGSPDQTDVAIFDDEGLDSCDPDDPLTLCLGEGGRFKVQVSFRNQVPGGGTTTDRGDALPLLREQDGEVVRVQDSGLFTFFDPNNAELLVKVLNFCIPPFDSYAVFYAATTNVEFTVTVVDTEREENFFRSNPLGRVPETVLSVDALATCP